MAFKLYPYQTRGVHGALTAVQRGAHPCVVAPTGAGKSVMLAATAQRASGEVTIVSHRLEIADQLRDRTGRPVLSWQAVAMRDVVDRSDGVLLIDECHHAAAPHWGKLQHLYPNRKRVGFTATPVRSDGLGLAPFFTELIVAAQYSELIAAGMLVPCRVFRPASEQTGLARSPYEAYMERAQGRRVILFGGAVEPTEQFIDEFRTHGINAHVVHGNMRKTERRDIISRRPTVLGSVQVLTEGWDDPEVSCCILASKTDAVGTYIQKVGRALRAAPGKVDAVLLDLYGVSHRLGLPTQDRHYFLDGKHPIQAADGPGLTVCPFCGWCYELGPDTCPSCGESPPRVSRIPHVEPADLIEAEPLKPADPDELDRLVKLARENDWGTLWAVKAYMRTHELPRKLPEGLYSRMVYEYVQKGRERIQAHAIVSRMLRRHGVKS